jgi:beta-exotoxin I transport system permease protein
VLRNVWLKTLRDQRRALAGWGTGMVLLALLYGAFFPSIRDNAAQLNSYVRNLPEALRNVIGNESFTSPEGYLRSEVFSTMGPLLLLVFAIGAGSRAIAGEEEGGTLDVLLSTPLARWSAVLQKFAAVLTSTLLLAAILCAALWGAGPVFDMRVPIAQLAAACLQTALLALSFGAIALAVGCATGRRAVALGATAALTVLAYLTNVLAPSVHSIASAQTVSPFYFALHNDAVTNGLDPVHAGVLAGIVVVAVAVAVATFERRDLAAR